MPNQTNNELLKIILAQSQQNAKNQLAFASEVSIFMNDQKKVNSDQYLVNSEIKSYLESNSKTNQKGLVEQVKENTGEIRVIKTEKKIEKAKQTLLGVIVGSVLAFLGKLLF